MANISAWATVVSQSSAASSTQTKTLTPPPPTTISTTSKTWNLHLLPLLLLIVPQIAQGFSTPNNNNNNPFQSLLNDMTSSIRSRTSNNPSSETMEKAFAQLSTTTTTSWEDIRKQLQSKQTAEERRFRSDVEKGIGPPSPLNRIRLFEESNREDDVRVTLYRDHASWCPYCQKVWMTLEEKRIPYRIEKVNMRCYGPKEPSFLRLQPSGNIPVAIIDGITYNQSNDIIYALEQTFSSSSHKPLVPTDETTAQKARQLLSLERKLFGAWMQWLTGGSYGKDGFVQVLQEVERELDSSSKKKGGDFFLGPNVSIVDVMFAPFLERMCASMLYFKGFQIRYAPGEVKRWKAINRWFDAMETLESYRLTKSDYYTHCWDLPPQLGGCTHEKAGKPYEIAINGDSTNLTPSTWSIPLQPHNNGIEPDWEWCGDENAARREAVERLVHNHANIISFAARGAGQRSMMSPGYSAPLSDPNAVPNDSVRVTVDACLKLVSLALLEEEGGGGGVESWVVGGMEEVVRVARSVGGREHLEDVAESLVYLRDRIGVPRDMRLPAARQLRGYLNWAIGMVLG